MTLPEFFDVSIITATIKGREAMLEEAIDSVKAQRVQPKAHLVSLDWSGAGTAATINPLIERTETEWFCRLDDDDILYAGHIETFARLKVLDHFDVVYTSCDGGPTQANRSFDPDQLRKANFIPATAFVRTSAALKVGLPNCYAEDWALYLRLMNAGSAFYHLPVVTWLYRTDHGKFRKTPSRPKGSKSEAQRAGGL